MNAQTLLQSSLYLSKEAFDISSVSRLYGCNKIPAIEIIQELLDQGLLSRHWRIASNDMLTPHFCRYTKDTQMLSSEWNSPGFYASVNEYSKNTPVWC
jgi:hypothetical protein